MIWAPKCHKPGEGVVGGEASLTTGNDSLGEQEQGKVKEKHQD